MIEKIWGIKKPLGTDGAQADVLRNVYVINMKADNTFIFRHTIFFGG